MTDPNSTPGWPAPGSDPSAPNGQFGPPPAAHPGVQPQYGVPPQQGQYEQPGQYGQGQYGQGQYGQPGPQYGYPQQAQGGGYGVMPPAAYAGGQPTGPIPAKVSLAMKLMFAQVALGIIGVLSLILLKSQLRDDLRDTNSSTDLDTLVNTAITVAIVFAVIFGVLYVLLALQVGKGKNWARIVTWVLAGLGLLSFLASLQNTTIGFSRFTGVIGALLDVGIIVLLAQSNNFFRRRAT